MDDEPDWAQVLRVLYHEGGHPHEWADPGDWGAIRPGDVGTAEYAEYIEWYRQLASAQYDRLADKTGFDHDTINDALNWLAKHGLVTKMEPVTSDDYEYDDRCPVELKSPGFEVARGQSKLHRQEQREQRRARHQNNVNRAIAFLTLGLMAVTVLDSAVRAFVGQSEFFHAFLTVGGGLTLVLIFVLLLGWSGLLSSYSPADD